MQISTKLSIVLFTSILAIGGMHIAELYGMLGITNFVTSAEAKVGRPLSPISVAGVARRSSR